MFGGEELGIGFEVIGNAVFFVAGRLPPGPRNPGERSRRWLTGPRRFGHTGGRAAMHRPGPLGQPGNTGPGGARRGQARGAGPGRAGGRQIRWT